MDPSHNRKSDQWLKTEPLWGQHCAELWDGITMEWLQNSSHISDLSDTDIKICIKDISL